MNTIFIHTNNKQLFGAVLAEYAIKRGLREPNSIRVEILNVDELPEFQAFAGAPYIRKGREVTYKRDDLQSFTLSRFMPPERMGYKGRAVVIDPDIFAIGDVSSIFNLDLQGNALAACRKKDAWDSSVMLMDCEKLTHWNIASFLEKLKTKTLDYDTLMALRSEPAILELSRDWNNLDTLTPETHFIHMTNRLTQPWKTGLPIDFTRNPMPKIFGFIPREPVHRLLGKYPMHYQPHPKKEVVTFFLDLVRGALNDGVITKEYIQAEINKGHIRKDLLGLVF